MPKPFYNVPNSKAFKLGKVAGDVLSLLAGVGADAGGAAGEAGGTVLDATGEGAVVGVPINVASAGAFVYGGTVIINSYGNFVKDTLSLIKNGGTGKGNIPVKDKTTASNGLDYQSNTKHTPGQLGNRPNAGIEPKNSLDLFGESIPSALKPNQRFTFDKETNTLHRFFEDGNGTWHWSGSTNQGANSIPGSKVPTDIKKIFSLPKKGW